MQPCSLIIATSTDGGEESVLSLNAEMELTPLTAVVRYAQEGSSVTIRVENGRIFVRRQGDYTLNLCLCEGKTTPGEIGVSGAAGKIETTARRIGYTIKENSLLLLMKYTLHFGGGSQEMKIKLTARSEKDSEE